MNSYTLTKCGNLHTENQDSLCVINLENTIFIAVADGVSTAKYAKKVSAYAVEIISEYVKCMYKSYMKDNEVVLLLKKAYVNTYKELRKSGLCMDATTLTVTLLKNDGSVYIGHIGDSCVIGITESGEYCLLTHSMNPCKDKNIVLPFGAVYAWQFYKAKKRMKGVLLATDGALVDTDNEEKKILLDCLFDGLNKTEGYMEQVLGMYFEAVAGEEWDDMTIIIAAIQEIV